MSDEQRPIPSLPAAGVVDYSTPKPHNRYAARALVFGLLGFLPFVPGILAIRYARRGLRDVEADPKLDGRGQAKAGLWLGAASIVAWVALTIAAVPAGIQARRQARRVQCMSQLRQVGLSLQLYAVANSGRLPSSFDDVLRAGTIAPGLLQCPACAGDPTKPVASTGAFGNYHYVYLGGGRTIQSIKLAATEPLAYEPLTNHDDPGFNVVYADGHAELLPASAMQAFLQKYAPPGTQPAATLPAEGSAVEK